MNAKDQALIEEQHYLFLQSGLDGRSAPAEPQAAPTVHFTELPDAPESPLCQEWRTYRREVSRLLAEGHLGRHVLIQSDQVVGIWDSHDEAMKAGYERFFGAPFLVHQIQERERVFPLRAEGPGALESEGSNTPPKARKESAMIRALVISSSIFFCSVGVSSGQAKSDATQPAESRDELRYDGKLFSYWETFMRTELKAERRIDAVRALAAFGARGRAKEATAAIVELLKEYDNDVAAFQIDRSAPEKGTPDQRIIHETRWALGKIGPEASPVLVAHLDRKAVRWVAQELLVPGYGATLIAPTESSVPLLVRWITSKDEEIRDVAIAILGTAILNEPQTKKETGYRAIFIETVTKEKGDKAIVDSLAQALEGENGELTVLLLAALGPRAKPAASALVRAELWSKAASDILAEIKPSTAERIAGLVMALKGSYRGLVAAKLGEMGTDARAALPDLANELKKPLRDVSETVVYERMAFLDAFVKIAGPKESLPTVFELLDKHPFPPLERELVNVWLKLESDPKRVVPMLTKSLQRQTAEQRVRRTFTDAKGIAVIDDSTFVDELIDALGARGEGAASAVPALLKAYEKLDDTAKLKIVATLGKIGPAAGEALPTLTKLLQSQNADMRQAAAQAIEAITKKK